MHRKCGVNIVKPGPQTLSPQIQTPKPKTKGPRAYTKIPWAMPPPHPTPPIAFKHDGGAPQKIFKK